MSKPLSNPTRNGKSRTNAPGAASVSKAPANKTSANNANANTAQANTAQAKPLHPSLQEIPRRAKPESSLDLPAGPVRAGESRQAWVYRQIQEGILKGALASGARLPSTRSLSQRWRVSRSTVEAAYDQLRSEGYTSGTVGSGTYVSAVIPDNFFRRGLPGGKAQDDVTPASPRHASTGGHRQPDPGARLTSSDHPAAALAPQALFSARIADASLFPMASWRKGLMTSARRVSPSQLANEESQGCFALREQVARYLGAARGISCDASQIVILTGIRDGLDLSARILLTRQDKALVEDPGYLTALPLFSQFTPRVVPIAIDAQGFSVARARRQRGVKLVHVTPAHQSPIGVTMPVSRRLELLAWAEAADCWIVEDDYDSEFNYDSAPLPALKSLDTADRVIHLGSFNKTMFNALRIGYAVVPKRWVPAFTRARYTTGRASSMIEQMSLAGFLEDGSFARHVRKARAVYAQRRDRVLQVLAEAAGGEPLRVDGAQAGFHLVWWLPQGVEMQDVEVRAHSQGLSVQSLVQFCRRVTLPPGLVIGYSGLQMADIQRQGELLRGLVASGAR